ncbi:KappaPI-actitoxin-Avd3d [Halotydeus destructor]|nr:KappaPI-actitoxin-Avd3d [Halotydeus destructor]
MIGVLFLALLAVTAQAGDNEDLDSKWPMLQICPPHPAGNPPEYQNVGANLVKPQSAPVAYSAPMVYSAPVPYFARAIKPVPVAYADPAPAAYYAPNFGSQLSPYSSPASERLPGQPFTTNPKPKPWPSAVPSVVPSLPPKLPASIPITYVTLDQMIASGLKPYTSYTYDQAPVAQYRSGPSSPSSWARPPGASWSASPPVAKKDPCKMDIVQGQCRAAFIRYGYNKDTNRCEEFVYGGCGGNENQFSSAEACRKACPQAKGIIRYRRDPF